MKAPSNKASKQIKLSRNQNRLNEAGASTTLVQQFTNYYQTSVFNSDDF